MYALDLLKQSWEPGAVVRRDSEGREVEMATQGWKLLGGRQTGAVDAGEVQQERQL